MSSSRRCHHWFFCLTARLNEVLTFAQRSAFLNVIIYLAVAGIMTDTLTCRRTLKVAFGRGWRMGLVLSAGPVEQLSLQITQHVMPAANSAWSVITPVEESVTFKMAHSQGSLPVIRNVYYGLWSHPVNVCVCGCGCVFLRALCSLSWRSDWVLKAIWLSDMNLHFPFLLLINVLQAHVLRSYSCSRLHSNIFNADFIDVLEFIQARITSMNFQVGAILTITTNIKK